jgi:hypothetical protein
MKKLKGSASVELLEGGKLKVADILLTHSKVSFWGWLIRLGTRCYWNHALILYAVRESMQGSNEALIIDPKMGSIRIGNISHYFENPSRYDVAVKRLDKEWFQKGSELEGLPYCQSICDIALRETTDKIDTRLVKISRRLLRQIRLVYRFARRKIKYPRPRKKHLSSITERLKISAYGCGGFVQWCYYQGTSQILREHHGTNILKDVIFNPQLFESITQRDLLSTTPADLARSDKLSWKYIIKNGTVWSVSSEEDVNLILKSAKEQNYVSG